MTNTILLLKEKYDNYYRMATEKYETSFEGWSYFGDGGRAESFNTFYCELIFDWDSSNTLSEEEILMFETEHEIILPVEYREFLKYVANGHTYITKDQWSIFKMLSLRESDSYPKINSEELNLYRDGSHIPSIKECVSRMIALGDFDGLLEDKSKINLSSPFPHEEKYNEELLELILMNSRRYHDFSENAKDIQWQSVNIPRIENAMKKSFQKSNIDGCIIIAKISNPNLNGCDLPIYFLLVVKGKEYGNIWVDMRLINKGIVPYDESFRFFFFRDYTVNLNLFEEKDKNRYNFVEFIDDVLSERLLWYEYKSK